jgi:hypothetical protein
MKALTVILSLLVGGCASSSVTVESPPTQTPRTLAELSGDYEFVGIIRRRMWQRDVPATIFDSFPKWQEFPEGGADEILRVRVPDVDTIIFSSGIASAERRRIFKRGADFQVEGSTPVFVIPDFRVEPEGAVGKGSGHARLFKTEDGGLAVRFDVRFRMRAALIMPYSDDEQAWAIFRKKEPNKAPEPTRTSVTSPAAQEPRQP